MGLREDILKEPVTALELRELITIKPTTTVEEAVTLMRKKSLGCVVMVDEAGRPMGKFTERRLIRLLLNETEALSRPVEHFMGGAAWGAIEEHEPISQVIDCMQEKGLRFVIVTNREGKAIALTGQKGVMEYIAEHFPRQVKVQSMQSRVSINEREGA